VILMLFAFDIRFGYFSINESADAALTWIALAVTAASVVWGAAGATRQQSRAF
jgi:hypothetical protein